MKIEEVLIDGLFHFTPCIFFAEWDSVMDAPSAWRPFKALSGLTFSSSGHHVLYRYFQEWVFIACCIVCQPALVEGGLL